MKNITLFLFFALITNVVTAQINVSYIMAKPIFAAYVKNDTTLAPSELANYYVVTKNPVTINLPATTDSLAKNSSMYFIVTDSVMTMNFNRPIYATSGGGSVSSYTLSSTATSAQFRIQKYAIYQLAIWNNKWAINGHRPQ